MQHYLSVFCKAIRSLESQSVDSTDIYDIMSNLRDQISSRYEKEFFGFIVKQALPSLTTYEQKKFRQEALAVYKRALDYLRKWFDFDNSVFKKFKLFKLEDVFGQSFRFMYRIWNSSKYFSVQTNNLLVF